MVDADDRAGERHRRHQGGTTHEGVHLGAIAGSVDMVVRCYAGLEIRHDRLWLHPVFPPELGAATFTVYYREPIRLEMSRHRIRLRLDRTGAPPITVDAEETILSSGDTRDFPQGPSSTTGARALDVDAGEMRPARCGDLPPRPGDGSAR